MINKDVAIVLGGTAPHKALIEKLKTKGYYTVLVDYFDDPPAAAAADKHIPESALDNEKVLEIARNMNAKLILSTALDQQLVTACLVSEKLGLPTLFSHETALEVTNKELMKKKMYENGIPTSKFTTIADEDELIGLNLNFPVMIKPADSCGSAGVKKINDIRELKESLSDTLEWSRSHTAIIEEFVDGQEISVYAFVKDKKANILLIAERFTKISEKNDNIKCFATLAPANFPSQVLNKIQKISDRIADVFKLENTPMIYQFFVKDDNIDVIEFSARLGGGISFRTVELCTGVDLMEATVKAYLNEPIDITVNRKKMLALIHLIYAYTCTFDHVEGIDELIRDGFINEIHYHKTKGATVHDDKPSSARIAAYLVLAENKNELLRKLQVISERCEVYDTDGREVMMRDLYLKGDLINSNEA